VNGDAVRRYKELADLNTAAVLRMREHNQEVVKKLRVRLAQVDEELARAIEQEWLVRFTVRLNWENAVDSLWSERWLKLGPQPGPARPPPGMTMAQADAEVSRTFEALQEALRKPALLPRRQHEE
jgi:hypothetical protein